MEFSWRLGYNFLNYCNPYVLTKLEDGRLTIGENNVPDEGPKRSDLHIHFSFDFLVLQLSWTFEKEGMKLEWRWKCHPSTNSKKTTVDVLDFLMDANIKLSVSEKTLHLTLHSLAFFFSLQLAKIIIDANMFPNLQEFCLIIKFSLLTVYSLVWYFDNISDFGSSLTSWFSGLNRRRLCGNQNHLTSSN